MDKKLLLEIGRLQGLISYSRSNPIDYSITISEQVPGMPNNGMITMSNSDPNEQGYDEDYNVVEIGPYNNPKYPTMLNVKIPVVTKPRTEPSIKQFNSETSMKNFLGSSAEVKEFVEGDKLSNGKPAPIGVQYIEKKDGKKYCLPSPEWIKLHTDKKYVYQFTNQKTNESFGLRFALDKKQSLKGVTYTGSEISQMCPGGNNGWVFTLDPATQPITMFFNIKTGKPFNPSKDGNSQSDFDDWWDEWKTWVELGVGILAGFLTGGLSNIILVGAEALAALEGAALLSRVGRFLIFLNETAWVAGSETSWLRLASGIFLEAGMMTPIALQYLEEGDDDQAILAWAFCLLPFITELPAVGRFIKTGTFGKQEIDKLSTEILQKLKSSGGYKTVTRSIDSEWTYISSLSDDARELYMGMKRMIVTDPNVLKQGFEIAVSKNSEKILEAAGKSTKPEIKTALGKANNMLNPLPKWGKGGRGLLPVIGRAFTVVTPIVVGSMAVLEYFKSLGLSDKVAKNLSKQAETAINSNQYWVDLASLNKSLGLSNLTEKQTLTAIKQLTEKDPEELKKMVDSDVAKENFYSDEQVTQMALKAAQENNAPIRAGFEEHGKELINDTRVINGFEMLRIINKQDSLKTLIKKFGHNISEWVDTSDKSKWTFVTDKGLDGEVIFNPTNETYYVTVDGQRIT